MQQNQSLRILVTGGAGFIGSHTVDVLLAAGHDVVVLDNLSSGKLDNLNLAHPNLEMIEGDVLEYHFLADLIANCNAVLHLAAIVSVPLSLEQPIYTFQVNTQGTLHVLQAIHAARRPIRFVFASSAAVYGDPVELPCDDTRSLTAPAISPYGLQKLQSEQYADLYARVYDVSSLALRYFNVYGSRQDPNSPYSGVISRFVKAYREQSDLTIYGDGEQTRDFIHIQDIARANLMALEHDATGVLNIATGQQVSLLRLISTLTQVGGQKAKVVHEKPRSGDILASYATTEQAKLSLGFQASTSLSEGLGELLGK